MSTVDLGILIKAVDQATPVIDGVKKPLHGLGSAMHDVGKIAAGFAIGGLITQIGGGLTGALSDGVKHLKNFAGETAKLSRETGLSAESTSSLLAVLNRTGVDAEGASKSLGIFAKHLHGIDDAEGSGILNGKGFAKTMKEIGVHFEDAAGQALPMNQVLYDVADKFKSMPDGVDKTALSMELFGRGGKDMLKFLNMGAEGIKQAEEAARKYGLTLTKDNLVAVKEFGLAHKDMDMAIEGLTLQIGVAFMPIIAKLAQAVAALAMGFNQLVMPAIRAFAEMIKGPVKQAGDIFQGALEIINALILAFTVDAGAMGIVYDVIRRVFGDGVADFLQPFLHWFMLAIPEIQHFVETAKGVFEVLLFEIQAIFTGEIPDAFQAFIDDLVGVGGMIVEKLAEWAKAFIEWVAPLIPPMLAEVGKLLATLGAWLINPALPTIISHLLEWGRAFVEWLAPHIPPLLVELVNLAGQITGWIVTEALPLIVGSLIGWGIAFVRWVADNVLPALPGALQTIIDTIVGWVNGAVGQAQAEGANIGVAMVQGLAGALMAGIETIKRGAVQMVMNTVQAARNAADIHSPSGLFYWQVGVPMAEGVALALTDSSQMVGAAAATMVAAAETEMIPAVQAVEKSIKELADSAGLNMALVRAEAKASGMDLRQYLQEIGGTAADTLSAAMVVTATKTDALKTPMDVVKLTSQKLAKDGLDVAKDAATQISFVLQQLNDKLPQLIGRVDNLRRSIEQLHDKTITITTVHRDVYQSSGRGQHRADGGPVFAGQTYTVGERGEETFVPNTDGYIVPHGGGGGGVVVKIMGPVYGFDDFAARVADAFDLAQRGGQLRLVPR